MSPEISPSTVYRDQLNTSVSEVVNGTVTVISPASSGLICTGLPMYSPVRDVILKLTLPDFVPVLRTNREKVESSPTCHGPSVLAGDEPPAYSNNADSTENTSVTELIEEGSNLCPLTEQTRLPGLTVRVN